MYKTRARINCQAINFVLQIQSRNYGLKASFSFKHESSPYDLYKLDSGPATTAELTRKDALDYLNSMYLLRKMEREISVLYSKKLVRGFCHLYSGQEAIGVGIKAMLSPKDTVIGSYRCHGWTFLMGVTIEAIVAELLGRTTGCARGKGGSMHMYGPMMYGGNSIVGAHVPLGTGLALAHKYKKDGGCSVTVYGDGATDQGQVYESMNLSKLLHLPAFYVIENNTYSMGTSITRHAANQDLYTRGDLVPGIRMDGMDILSVREGARFCLNWIRSGNGPIVLELLTYRYFGHSMSDPGTSYRSREEVKSVRESRDPITLLKNKILTSELASEEEITEIDKAAAKTVSKAVEDALKGKDLDLQEVAYDIYCKYTGKVRMPGFEKYIVHKNTGFSKDCK